MESNIDWENTNEKCSPQDINRKKKLLIQFLKVLSWNDKCIAIDILKKVQKEFDDNVSFVPNVAPSIKSYFKEITRNSQTKKSNEIQNKIDTVIAACVFDETINKDQILSFFEFRKRSYDNVTTEYHRKQKRWKDCCLDIAKQCVDDFYHSEEATRIDTNQFKFHEVSKTEKYPYRIWNNPYWYQRFDQFVNSSCYARYRSKHNLLTIGKTRFRQLICPCIKDAKAHSCVNIPMTALSELMLTLKNFHLFNPSFNEQISACDCPMHSNNKNFETMLKLRPEEMLELTLCKPKMQSKLLCNGKIPKVHSPTCVDSCALCGVKKLKLDTCPIWNNSTNIVSAIIWDKAECAGGKTQLEPMEKLMPINQVFQKFIEALDEGRSNFVRGEWSNLMRKIDINESNKDDRIILTDFSATLDLRARMSDNCSVDNHAVLDIYFVLMNFRTVTLKDGSKIQICDTSVFCFFVCSISAGKKNDHVFHVACQEYIMELTDVRYTKNSVKMFKRTINWTDNCPTQYKCRQNFIFIATHPRRNPETELIHKFAEKFQFKGSWDGIGKNVKKFLWDCEMGNKRCGNAFACYDRCRKDFPTNNPKKWKQYEQDGDLKLMQKNPFCYDTIEFGFVVESMAHYNQLKEQGHKHVVYTNRKEIGDDVAPVEDTNNFFQVNSAKTLVDPQSDSFPLYSYTLPCSCSDCRFGDDCTFLNMRDKKRNVLKLKKKLVSHSDEELKNMNIERLTIPALKCELLFRNLSTSHNRKLDLINRLNEYLQKV